MVDPSRFEQDASGREGESLQEWWDAVHLADNQYFLTGSRWPPVAQFLELSPPPHSTILEIGVGRGYCTQELADAGHQVHALDISEVARRRVSALAPTYGSPFELPSATFDLAFSHLVSQHMKPLSLVRQIAEVLRALKPGAKFAMQFAAPPAWPDAPLEQLAKAGRITRSVSEIDELVRAAHGRIDWLKYKNILHWYAVHIVPHTDRES